jgi:hypothetical protein
VGGLPTLWALKLIAVLGLGGEFREARNISILHSIDIHSILFHVKFEDGLSISVMNNRVARPKNLRAVSKKSQDVRPLHFKPRLLQILVCFEIGQDMVHRCLSKSSRWLDYIQKIQVIEMISSMFY